ncbi:hypothetical protein LLH06_19115 [Mucilaginibacter daejeonensis]|uniref:carboxypeptidase-like regulatory domain-containing protein n=1 Tax=Mucilaginibacter daejeonensis TaxID=398049 RepID=UPI001D176BE1|nr:carboxypeptidase-like regulatory domain-containing protein [Mucilaginibacter daejeonensis]UEG53059.1 hypothetical protein LLH06_19115 [Mucilaginibacter daejeonensis]
MKKALSVAVSMLAVAVSAVRAQIPAPPKTTKLFFEKVYLHTDRQVYTPTDDVWYKAYLVNAQDGHLLNTSKDLYVELITPEGKILQHQILALNNGLAKGDLHIPDSLMAGNYRLRAYTNWMRNFGDNFIFEKTLRIVTNKADNKPAPVAGELSVRFFPEGGSLVSGLSSIVAVKAELSDGKAQALLGAVLSSQGDTVAHFDTDSAGVGSFALLPLPGQTYKARISRQSKTFTLPTPLGNGLALKIMRKDTTCYAVVSCNEAATATYAPQTLTIKVRTYGRVTYQQNFQLKGNTAAVVIPAGQLPAGISSITLYDGQQKPNCERLIYLDNAPKYALDLKLNKPAYQTREQVALNVTLTDKAGKPVNSNFSMAAVDAGVAPMDDDNITSYLMLRSELKGDIVNPARYFDTTNVQRYKQLDLLLLTQGWRDLIWKRLADTALRIAYIPEQGLSLSGTVQDKKKAPLPNANITLTAPGASGRRLFWAKTNEQGRYFFDALQLYGQQTVHLTSKDNKGKSTGVLTLDSLTIDRPAIAPQKPEAYLQMGANMVNNAALVKQVALARQRSLSDTLIRLKDVEVKKQQPQQVLRDRPVTSFGYKDEVLTIKPEDKRYNTLRDYIQFTSKQARVDAANNRLYFVADGKSRTPRFVIDNRDALFNDNDPDDVIDMISNSYLDLPTTSVEKVVIKKMIGGPSLVLSNPDGSAAQAATPREQLNANSAASSSIEPVFVIYLTLKPDAFKTPEPGSVKARIEGYYEARTFYEPVYDNTRKNERPDTRPTLHWEPMGTTGATGNRTISFYNSDSKTNVRIVVQGITDTGVPVTAVRSYNVK